jgi:serine/threonine protein kinase
MIGVHVIAQRYRLEERLGSGGMGVVWRATDLELRRVVAVKKSQDGDGAQIRREARIGASLHHPHIVSVFDSVIDGDDRWLVMEYLPARSLEVILRADGRLPPSRVAAIGAQIAEALVAMHAREMVHRDITPGNVLVTDDGTAKLADLGISRWAEVTVTGSAEFGGTAGYLAPEVAEGHEAGTAADIFSLGATLFAAVEGVSPWGGGEHGPFAQLRRAADYRLERAQHSDSLAPVLDALLERQPGQRPTAAEAQALLAGEPPQPSVPAIQVVPARPRRVLSRRQKVLAGAVTVAAVVLAAGVLVFTRDDPPSANAAVNLLGDPRTADPCSLLTVNSLSTYGKVLLDPNQGNFSRCDLNTTLPDNGGTMVTSLDLQGPTTDQAVPPTPGRLGTIQRLPLKDGACERSFNLPDMNTIIIKTVRGGGKESPSDQPCAMSEAVTLDVYNKVSTAVGPLARRLPFAPDSLAQIDACTLLDDATIDKTVGTGHPVDRYLGAWACSWGSDSESIDLYYSREWPVKTNDPDDGETRAEIANRPAYVDPHENDGDECEVMLSYRTYTPAIPPVKGDPLQRDEVVVVDFVDEANKGKLDTICGTAKSLAGAMAARLPAS